MQRDVRVRGGSAAVGHGGGGAHAQALKRAGQRVRPAAARRAVLNGLQGSGANGHPRSVYKACCIQIVEHCLVVPHLLQQRLIVLGDVRYVDLASQGEVCNLLVERGGGHVDHLEQRLAPALRHALVQEALRSAGETQCCTAAGQRTAALGTGTGSHLHEGGAERGGEGLCGAGGGVGGRDVAPIVKDVADDVEASQQDPEHEGAQEADPHGKIPERM